MNRKIENRTRSRCVFYPKKVIGQQKNGIFGQKVGAYPINTLWVAEISAMAILEHFRAFLSSFYAQKRFEKRLGATKTHFLGRLWSFWAILEVKILISGPKFAILRVRYMFLRSKMAIFSIYQLKNW